ncbi:MAG: methyltransferase domain-containing protein [Clostridia bacterium]|nr:methyltransferase domain-containing protein [Clostridia bacterium]MDR3644350.1 methyltransferase domain-containing protein [Clostridia bacterium]
MTDWDSSKYLKFGNERTQPAIDLVNRIHLEKPEKILDIGCGPGNSSEVLAQRYPDADILGIDNSPAMIEAARVQYPDIRFMQCDANRNLRILDRDFDIVFSNACIQWIPGHDTLLKNMMYLLKPGGVIAIQTPMNYQEPIHQIIKEISTSHKWSCKFENPRIFYNLTQSEYYDLLSNIASDFCMWQITYFHRMKSHSDIMEWYRATGLRPYLNVLSETDRSNFEKDIYDELIVAYPKQNNGEIIFRFPRFFFTATK